MRADKVLTRGERVVVVEWSQQRARKQRAVEGVCRNQSEGNEKLTEMGTWSDPLSRAGILLYVTSCRFVPIATTSTGIIKTCSASSCSTQTSNTRCRTRQKEETLFGQNTIEEACTGKREVTLSGNPLLYLNQIFCRLRLHISLTGEKRSLMAGLRSEMK